MLTVLRRFWVPVLVVVVIVLGVFMVDRLRGVFGKTELTRPGAGLANDPEPFNPKEVRYEIFGQPGATATINFLDLDAQPQEAEGRNPSVGTHVDHHRSSGQRQHRRPG